MRTLTTVGIAALLFLTPRVWAGQAVNQYGLIDLCATIKEEDGSPSATGCQALKITNGSLTDNGDGTFSLSLAAGAGDITAVGDCATGACFEGSDGALLTFNNASGDQTLSFDNTTQDFELSNDLTITDATPHIRLTDSTASSDDFEIYAEGSSLRIVDVTDSVELIRVLSSNTVEIPVYTRFGTTIELQNGETIINSTDNRITFGLNAATVENLYFAYSTDTTVDFASTSGITTMQMPWSIVLTADDRVILFGAGADARIEWDTAETNDALKIGIDVGSAAQSGNILIVQDADISTNFGAAIANDPTLRIQSSDATTTADYISFYHDQTNPYIAVGNGTLQITGADLNVNNDLDVTDDTPHVRWIDSDASSDDFEWYADASAFRLTNVTDSIELMAILNMNGVRIGGPSVPTVQLQSTAGIQFDTDADGTDEITFNTDGSITTTGAGTERIEGASGEYIDFDDGGDGKICMGGSGGTNNETYCFDFETTANSLAISSLSSGTSIRFTGGGSVWGGTVSLDGGTGAYGYKADGSTGGCLMLRDTDDAGWTECCALNGVLTCAIDADGTIDGTL